MKNFLGISLSAEGNELKPFRQNRSKAYSRFQRQRVINRKWDFISKYPQWVLPEDEKGRPIKGHLAKGKIHCSCYRCRCKTWELGWKHSEVKHRLRFQDREEG